MNVVVTVAKNIWNEWLTEGNLAGDPWDGVLENHFWINKKSVPKDIAIGDRVYVVSNNKLRGYSPLLYVETSCSLRLDRACFLRRNDAVAVTLNREIKGFQGWRYQWWDSNEEIAFPNWKTP